MAKSIEDDEELKRACQAAIEGTKKKSSCLSVSLKAVEVGVNLEKLGRNHMAKPRVLAISMKAKLQRTKAFLRVLKYSSGGILEPAKIYKLKHLSKVEVVSNDPSGCTFMLVTFYASSAHPSILGFDNLRSQSVSSPQWTMRNTADRNRLIVCILNICKEILGRLPKVIGMDVVEMAIWAKSNPESGPVDSVMTEDDLTVAVERDLVSKAEEEDMEALLGIYVMGIGEAEASSERLKRELLALEAANVHPILENEPIIDEVLQGLESATICVEDMDEWLGIFNVKLRHMREDIESIETRNNNLEMQSINNKALIDELDKLLERLRVPPEIYIQFKEKRGELAILKSTFVRRASEYLSNYFANLVDFMMSDKSYFSQRGQLKRPDHADLRYKCRTYARLLQHIKSLDARSMGSLRKTYCQSLNLLLYREEDFYAVVDWACKIDPLRCISIHGFVDEACRQIERNERNVKQMGVQPYIPRFAVLATRMEEYIRGQNRDLVDQAYTKLVSIVFVTSEKIAQVELQYSKIVLFENYAAFQNSLYEPANIVPTLAKFYHQASEAYEQASTRHINMVIYIHFGRLFLFARRVEDLMFTMNPEEIPYQLGLSKADLRKVLKSSLSGVDKSISAMYWKLGKNLTSEELLPSLWDKFKRDFLDKYVSFVELVAKIYLNEPVPAPQELKELLANI
ncbi:hypothetical protein MKX01_039016 [Papaver californicum]|nr:hypothetical protein MKX01_039016 [Papaver californicum]